MTTLEALQDDRALPVVPPIDEVRLPISTVGTVRCDDKGIEIYPPSVGQVEHQIPPGQGSRKAYLLLREPRPVTHEAQALEHEGFAAPVDVEVLYQADRVSRKEGESLHAP